MVKINIYTSNYFDKIQAMKKEEKKSLSIIVPCYNEESCIDPFVQEINAVFDNNSFDFLLDYSIVFVDDGSTDSTLNKIIDISRKNTHIKYISFSRNFGKEAALFAGLRESYNSINSEYYVIMDVDLQDPPCLLPKMIGLLHDDENIERVATRRVNRKGEPPIRSIFARMFYKLMNRFSQVELVDGARDYQLMTKKFVKAMLDCNEYNRFFKGLSQWVGFNTKWLEFENVARKNGETKWSFWGLLKYSIEGIIAYSTWPLKLISVLGILLSFLSIIALIVVFIRALVIGDPVAGWPSLVCILLLIGGLIMTSLGVIGLYFDKAYMEVKNRPIYIVNRTNV